MKKIFIRILLCLIFSQSLEAEHTFSTLLEGLKEHPSIGQLVEESERLKLQGAVESSIGDPMLMTEVREVPLHSLSFSKKERTEMMIGLSQRFSFSGKNKRLAQAYTQLSRSKEYESQDTQRQLELYLWGAFIERKSLLAQLEILRENKRWLENIQQVTTSLYASGQVGQQDVFDVRIQISNIEALIFEYQQKIQVNNGTFDFLSSAKSTEGHIDISSAPWSLLEARGGEVAENDFQWRSLQAANKATEYRSEAARRARIPDVTVSLSYMKMPNMMGDDEFIGASLSFPIPLSTVRHSQLGMSLSEKRSSRHRLRNYELKREQRLNQYRAEIKSLENELRIVRSENLENARNSREITFRNYRRGGGAFKDLQLSQTALLNELLREQKIKERLNTRRVAYLYQKGVSLSD